MKISGERLISVAELTGFRVEVLEKVIHLLNLLEGLARHPFLQNRLVLKGGTALNLFLLDVPRLSVDVDLNYIGSASKDVMLAERPKVEEAIGAVCHREGLSIRRVPSEHAGGKWQLRYESALGDGGNLELDLNFMLRIPIWPATVLDSRPIGPYKATKISVLDLHELTAGKLAALLARHTSRDLFDAHHLLTGNALDRSRLRLAFVVYGAMNRKDWRTVSAADVYFGVAELRDSLLPLMRREALAEIGSAKAWTERLVAECREALGLVLPLTHTEREFLDRLLERGEIEPSLLTNDAELAKRIGDHPGLAWKAMNVRRKG